MWGLKKALPQLLQELFNSSQTCEGSNALWKYTNAAIYKKYKKQTRQQLWKWNDEAHSMYT